MVILKVSLYFVTLYLLAFEGSDNAVAGFAVTVGVHGFAHALVGCRVVKNGADFVHNEVVVGANKMDGAALKSFGTLGGVPHHEDGLAKTGGFFLDAA